VVQPFDYSIRSTAQGPLQALSQGMQLGQQFAQIAEQRETQRLRQQMEQEKLRQAQEAAAAEQAARGVYFSDPNPTNALRWQATLTADMAKALNPGIETLSRDQLTTLNTNGLRDYALLTSGRADMVMSDLQAQARARREANDEPGARRLEDVAEVVRVSPQAVASTLLAQVASRPGGAELVAKFNEARKLNLEQRENFETLTAQQATNLGLPSGNTYQRNKETGKIEVLTQGGERFDLLSQAEASSLGLPKDGVYQRSTTTGKVSAIGAPTTQINLPAEGGKAALKELDLPRAQQFTSGAASARAFANDAKVIADLLKNTGGGDIVKLSTALMSRLGIQTDTVAAVDLANSLSVRGATQIRPPGSGSTSDTEFRAYLTAFPSLQNSARGREIMAKYGDAIAKRSAKLADHARKLIREDRFSEEEMADFDDNLGPVLQKDFWDLVRPSDRAGAAQPPPPIAAPAPARGATAPAPTAAPSPISAPQVAPQAAPPVVRQTAAPSFAPLPPAPPSPPPAPLPGGRTQVGSVPSPVPAQREAPPNVGVVMPERGTTRFQVTAPNGATYYFPTRAAAEEFKRRGGF
jgi:hypothetical protein